MRQKVQTKPSVPNSSQLIIDHGHLLGDDISPGFDGGGCHIAMGVIALLDLLACVVRYRRQAPRIAPDIVEEGPVRFGDPGDLADGVIGETGLGL
jgi:hypothetical protein